MRWFCILLLFVYPVWADEDKSGEFDYYVLSLSWSPNWCALEGRSRGSEQCDKGREYGWVMHGLWPQYESGWPAYCRTSMRDPSRAETAAMADIMGTSGAAWYQWKKHGRCSGLSSEQYFELARQAYNSVNRPEVFRKLDEAVRLPASVIEEAFLEQNPSWAANMLTITCKSNYIQEARLCLTKDLTPRVCSIHLSRDCKMNDAQFEPIK